MSRQITISDDAWIILKSHMREAGTHDEESEMDELFGISDQVWVVFTEEHRRAQTLVRHP